jgi:hypothetical protein
MNPTNKHEYYIDQYKQLHTRIDTFTGISIRYYVKDIDVLIKSSQPKTLLDFGCGKGKQYTDESLRQKWGKLPHELWGIMPTLYDPAVPAYSYLPKGKFGGVICTDVMEHVPEDSVDLVLDQIISRADKFVFIAIATYVGKATSLKLPNGEQPHITVYNDEWWIDRVKQQDIEGKKIHIKFNGRKGGIQTMTEWKNF